MKKLAATLVMSLLLQTVAPMQVMAAENGGTIFEPYSPDPPYQIEEVVLQDENGQDELSEKATVEQQPVLEKEIPGESVGEDADSFEESVETELGSEEVVSEPEGIESEKAESESEETEFRLGEVEFEKTEETETEPEDAVSEEAESEPEELESTLSSFDADEVTVLEGFIQKTYYSRPDADGNAVYKLFVGALFPDTVSSVKQVTDVSYQLGSNAPIALETLESDDFSYGEGSHVFTLSLGSSPASVEEGEYNLTVNFTVDDVKYQISGSTELADKKVMIDWAYWGEPRYFSSKAGSTIEMFSMPTLYTFWDEEIENTDVKLVSQQMDGSVLIPNVGIRSWSTGESYDSRSTTGFTSKGNKNYYLDSRVFPKDKLYRAYGSAPTITLEEDVTEGAYDIVINTSDDRTYTLKDAYFATSKAVVYNVFVVNDDFSYAKAVNGGIIGNKRVFFSDNTDQYVAAFVYGINIKSGNIPTFYETDDMSKLSDYNSDDPECGYEYGSKWGYFFSLSKAGKGIDLAPDGSIESHVKVAGDVIYVGGEDYCNSHLSSRSVFFEEYLRRDSLYSGSPGWIRLYLGVGTACEVGDELTYTLNYQDSSYIYYSFSTPSEVKANKNGKYIEFGEDSDIFINWENKGSKKDEITNQVGEVIAYDYKLVTGGYGPYSYSIINAKNVRMPGNCSWEIHSAGEIPKVVCKGENTDIASASLLSLLTPEQRAELTDQGAFRVCIYQGDENVWYRQLVYFVDGSKVSVTGISIKDSVYTGKEVAYSGKLSAVTGDGEDITEQVTFSCIYSGTLADGTDYPASRQAPVDAGRYTLTVTISDSSGDYTGNASYNFEIKPALLTIKASDIAIGIGKELPEKYEYKASGLVANDKLIKEPEIVCDVVGTEQEGTYTITPSGADAGMNYEIEYETGKLTVAKEIPVTISGITLADAVYTGKSVSVSGDVAVMTADDVNVIDQLTLSYSYSGTLADSSKYESTKDAPVNVGDYTLTVSTPEDSVYVGQKTYNFKIKPAVVTITASDVSLKVGDALPETYEYKVSGLLNSDTLKTNPTVTCSAADTAQAGTYEIVPSGADAGNNYSVEYVKGTLKITAAAEEPEKPEEPTEPEKPVQPEDEVVDDNGYSIYPDEQRTDIKDCVISDISNGTYSGKAYTPVPKVILTVEGKELTLVSGKDYRLSYSDNVNAGTGTVYVIGIGSYKGHKSAKFNILPKDIGKLANVVSSIAVGNVEAEPISLFDGTKLLKKGDDYDYQITANEVGQAGTIKINVAGKANYSGSCEVSVQVVDAVSKKMIDASAITLQTTEYKYSGKACKPKVTVTVDGKKLSSGKDYSVAYKNNTNAGTAYVTVKGKGKSYTGTAVKYFTIKPAGSGSFSKVTVNNGKKLTYTGKQLNPAVIVTQKGKKLNAKKDYIVEYKNNLIAGPASVVITGIGNYEGFVSEKSFTINQCEMKSTSIKIKDSLNYTVKYKGITLKEGIDYKVTVGKASGKKTKLTFEGLGNFKGKVTKKNIKIGSDGQ